MMGPMQILGYGSGRNFEAKPRLILRQRYKHAQRLQESPAAHLGSVGMIVLATKTAALHGCHRAVNPPQLWAGPHLAPSPPITLPFPPARRLVRPTLSFTQHCSHPTDPRVTQGTGIAADALPLQAPAPLSPSRRQRLERPRLR